MCCWRVGNAATVQCRVCWESRYKLVGGSLKFWRHFQKYWCHCTSDNLSLSCCLSVITKPAVWSQGQRVQEENVQHTWRRLMEMWLPAAPFPSHFVTFGEWLKGGSWGHLKYMVQESSSLTVKLLERCEAWWWADRLLVLAWLSHVGPSLSLPETKNQTWTDPWQCRAALSCKQPGWGNNFNKNDTTKAYKAVSKLCWVTVEAQANKPWVQGCS